MPVIDPLAQGAGVEPAATEIEREVGNSGKFIIMTNEFRTILERGADGILKIALEGGKCLILVPHQSGYYFSPNMTISDSQDASNVTIGTKTKPLADCY